MQTEDPLETTPTHVRLPNWLRDAIEKEAKKRRHSLSSEIRTALMDRYAPSGANKGAP